MPATQAQLKELATPLTELPPDNLHDLLAALGGPAWFEIKGVDRSRRRVIVTLLHANEPSGLKAVQHLLANRIQPQVDLGIIVAAVDAALEDPLLSHRYLPDERDLNRCFNPPYLDNQGKLAQQIIQRITDYQPEAVIDCHNTSAHSDPFCVSVQRDEATLALASMFTDTVIFINQSLGTLLNQLPDHIPAVTVEFGSFLDQNADQLAIDTLQDFATRDQLATQNLPAEKPVRVLANSLRLETEQHLEVAYSASLVETADLTIINAIDQLNFRHVPPGTVLGWFKSHRHKNLVARDNKGTDRYPDYFSHEDGVLTNRVPMTLFMATTDPVVANNDCLLYFTET